MTARSRKLTCAQYTIADKQAGDTDAEEAAMSEKSLIIIGAGLAGLATGVYAQEYSLHSPLRSFADSLIR